ncbi:hypothetical protein HK099_007263 [Clydaea vesicula]|uniref:Glutathione peroxidase n=1 Tax=Clydaea vesicula TaxID=447962 RepID=A0AAD5TXA5_9FUNG|nr:hypothetical protein HK099_007263 [Clydaea vesicula]
MVKDFQFEENEIGRYSGYLLSSFMFGQLLFSFFWGKLSDIIGRRPVLLSGLILTSFTCLAFGFSSSYKMAIIVRFITGSVNGIMGVSKTYLAEICDETNQGKGFSILGLNRALGLIIGPIIGGYFSNPSKKYPQIFPKGSFFDLNPYSLPTVIAFFVSIMCAVAAYYVLEETLNIPQPIKLHDEDERDVLRSADTFEEYYSVVDCSSSDSPTVRSSNERISNETTPLLPVTEIDSVALLDAKPSLFVLLHDKGIAVTLLDDESFVLWARLSKENGGIDWSSSEVGTAFSFGGIILLFYQFFVYPWVEKKIGILKAFRVGVLMTVPAYIILPRTSYLLDANENAKVFNEKTWVIWALVFFCQALRSISSLQAFTSVFIMVANATPANSLGTVNGFAQTLGKPFPFSALKGKPVLVVNVASKCGLTPQYKGLQAIHEKYHDKGLQIIGFPCNQFGKQEPGTNEEISTFCEANYGVKFTILEKIEVNGANTHPVYKLLKDQTTKEDISWNFEKFLVDKNGKFERFSPKTTPEELEENIKKIL